MHPSLSLLFLGDTIGKPGRRIVTEFLTGPQRPESDCVIVNVENSAHGFGVTEDHIKEFQQLGVDVFTGGNHSFDRKEIFSFIDNYPNLIRPANYPEGTPGKGMCICTIAETRIAVINLVGRIFMEPLRSPFLLADELIEQAKKETNIIIIDMHAEATAEKVAMGHYLDGRVSLVAGTHTHVETADERILPGGTAYITDIGCCGPISGIIGMDHAAVFRRLLKQLPARFEVAGGPAAASGVLVTIDKESGKAASIKRVRYEEPS
jgi:2',3'-cyclic-nucleotide 2'-phosphodiesterase